jgi:hypothetical protein
MAVNANLIRRPSDRSLFLAAAVGFPLLVLIGYFRSYYFSAFFDARPIANSLVHLHGIVMTLWVVYFSAQIALIRSKNVKLHMKMGMAGIALAALVIVIGLATAYDAQLVRAAAPPKVNPHSFFLFPVSDMVLFIILFAGAIYYRKSAAEHKSLMLLTAINFLPAALFRIPPVPEQYVVFWAFGLPNILALICLMWHTIKHRRLNKIFAAGVLLLFVALPLRIVISESEIWLRFVGWIAP